MRHFGRLPWSSLLFPLTILGFVGPVVLYVNQAFTTTNRWALAVLLAVVLVLNGKIGSGFRSDVGRLLLVSAAWALMTYFWSGLPDLTLMKGTAFVLVAGSLFTAGQLWVRQAGVERSLDYLLPIVGLAMLATLAGTANPQSTDQMGTIELYQGLVGNANMLGTLMAMAVPAILWRIYCSPSPIVRRLWLILLVVAFVTLLRANSRAALLVTLVTGMAFILSLPLRRWVTLALTGVVFGLLAVVLTPGLLETVEHRYIYKGASRAEGILVTREMVWEQSYALALQGGWIGGGYGVTIGDTSFEGGLSAVGYGREKANSQFAIMEETGIVGLVLYFLLLAALFRRLYRAFRSLLRPHERVLLALTTGMLTGLVIHMIFEAWWVAPGSSEFAYFWGLAGVAVGLSGVFIQRDRWEQWHQQFPTYAPYGSGGNWSMTPSWRRQ